MLRDSDRLYLQATVELARRGMYTCAPNPRVGCIIVRDGEVLGRGWHVRTGEEHAEVNALRDAADRDIRGATVYVSLEPCAFEGRTPACSQTLIKAGIARVVAAMKDPHPQVAGGGFADLEAAGVAVDVHELPAAAALNEGYISRMTRNRPFVRLKVASSLDARTAMASGESQWITGEAARAEVQYWRARSCAVITGSGTVANDDPKLTVRDDKFAVDGQIRQPLRVIVDSKLRTPKTAAVLKGPGASLLAHVRSTRPKLKGVAHFAAGTKQVDLAALVDHLATLECNEVLVEAGPKLTGAFIQAGLWDELILYQAPKLLGSDARGMAQLALTRMDQAIEATITDYASVGDDLRIRLRPV